MKILFVDEKSILIDGIAELLAKSVHDLVEQAKTVDEALNYFSEAEFDILITDFNLVDDNGLDLIRKAKKIYPKLKIIVLSMHDEAHLVQEILKEGVDGYVVEKNTKYNIAEALAAVDKGKAVLSDDISEILTQSQKVTKKAPLLTAREKVILSLISDEYTDQEIAEKLTITVKTVDSHRHKIFKKTKTSSVISLLKYAFANNLI